MLFSLCYWGKENYVSQVPLRGAPSAYVLSDIDKEEKIKKNHWEVVDVEVTDSSHDQCDQTKVSFIVRASDYI